VAIRLHAKGRISWAPHLCRPQRGQRAEHFRDGLKSKESTGFICTGPGSTWVIATDDRRIGAIWWPE